MLDDLERCILDAPGCDTALTALPCMLRLHEQGRTFDEIAAGLRAETGMTLTAAAVQRILRQSAGRWPVELIADADLGSCSPAPMEYATTGLGAVAPPSPAPGAAA